MSDPTHARARDEVVYHFTHVETNEVFLMLSLLSFFGFGLLGFVFAYVTPLNIVFGVAAVGGFLLFAFLEVFGSIVGYVYQKGLFKGILGVVGWTVGSIGLIIALAAAFAYVVLGGVFVFGTIMVLGMAILPTVLKPLLMIGYAVGAVAWAANGMSYWENTSPNPRVPPLGLVDWVRR